MRYWQKKFRQLIIAIILLLLALSVSFVYQLHINLQTVQSKVNYLQQELITKENKLIELENRLLAQENKIIQPHKFQEPAKQQKPIDVPNPLGILGAGLLGAWGLISKLKLGW